jgi:hypothetical protein
VAYASIAEIGAMPALHPAWDYAAYADKAYILYFDTREWGLLLYDTCIFSNKCSSVACKLMWLR